MGKTITHHEGLWIKYQMAIKNLTQADIAAYAKCTPPMVSHVIHGRKVSANVCLALVKALGYKSLNELIAAYAKEARHEGR
jgi:transcriptional regulator with XRE-family HTH domain